MYYMNMKTAKVLNTSFQTL